MPNENVEGVGLLDTIFDEVGANFNEGFVVIGDDAMVAQVFEITDGSRHLSSAIRVRVWCVICD